MGRMRATGLYRGVFKSDRSIEFERHYRLATAEFERDLVDIRRMRETGSGTKH